MINAVVPAMSYWPEHWQWLKNWLQLRRRQLGELKIVRKPARRMTMVDNWNSKERRKFIRAHKRF